MKEFLVTQLNAVIRECDNALAWLATETSIHAKTDQEKVLAENAVTFLQQKKSECLAQIAEINK